MGPGSGLVPQRNEDVKREVVRVKQIRVHKEGKRSGNASGPSTRRAGVSGEGRGAAARGGTLRRVFTGGAAAVVTAASLVVLPGTAHAAAFSVTKTADTNDGACDGDCSLREAVVAANSTPGPNTIAVPAGNYTMTIAGADEDAGATGDLDVTGEVEIQGAGASTTIFDANDVDRAFEIHAQARAVISDMSITGGFSAKPGGGIRVAGGSLTLAAAAVGDNVTARDAGGGGIWNGDGGRLSVVRSTISDNEGASGGGILNDGASMSMLNSTVSGNVATGASGGGGVLNANGASALVRYSTVADNEADGAAAGGHALAASGTAATIRVASSILAGPEGGLGSACSGFAPGMLSSGGYNVASDASCALAETGDHVGDALLDPLLASGGPTRTMLPSTGSPAIDRVPAGTSGCGTDVVDDQRGIERPQGDGCDAGAVEVERRRSPGCLTPPAGMRAWWTLDEAAGPTAFDTAGLANNGTRTGGPATIAGKVANALSFDGVDDYVSAPHHGELLFGRGSLSIDAWVRTTVRNGVQPIVDKRIQNGANKAAGYTLFLYDGRLSIQLGNGTRVPAGYFNYIPPASNSKSFVANGKWRHVVATVSRPSSPHVRLYVDGVMAATFPAANVLLGNLDDNGPLWIGRRRPVPNAGYGNVYFKGGIDEVELFNRPLTAAEVKSLYQAGPNGKCKAPANLTNLVPVGSVDAGVAAGDRRCPQQPYFRYVGGKPDSFGGGADPAYPSPMLQPFNPNPRLSYDQPMNNRWFGDSFNLEEGRRVCHAVLRVTARHSGDVPLNDGLTIGRSRPPVTPPPPRVMTPMVAQAINPGGSGTATSVWALNTAGIAALTTITSSTNNVDAVLDFYLQDDTTIDHIMLWVWYHP
jgi:CSLREA domain-containing protein